MVEDKKDVTPKKPESASGLPDNTASALCYVVGWVTGLVFFLIEKDNKTIRFHALQSMVIFGFIQIVVFVPIIGQILAPIFAILGLILWIVLIIKAYNGEKFDVPYVSEWVRSQIK